MARITRTLLDRRADDRKARVVVVQVWYFRFQRLQVPQFAVGTGKAHGVVAARGGVARGRAVQQRYVVRWLNITL